MLNVNLEGSRDYAQHFQFIFSCALDLPSQHKGFNISRVSELLTQHNINTHVLQSFSLNTKHLKYSCAPELLTQHKTSHQSCALGSTPNTNKHIYIYHQQLSYAQYIKQNIMFICSGVFDPIYENKTS